MRSRYTQVHAIVNIYLIRCTL